MTVFAVTVISFTPVIINQQLFSLFTGPDLKNSQKNQKYVVCSNNNVLRIKHAF
jgi:hypothetical protein